MQQQWRTQDFHLGDADNGQVEKLTNKIKKIIVLFKKFLEPRRCGHTRVLTCRSAPMQQ